MMDGVSRLEMNDLYYDLIRAQLDWDASHGWTRVKLSGEEVGAMHLVEAFTASRRRVYTGGWQVISDSDARVRWVDADVWPVTDGELGRQYLHHCARAAKVPPPEGRVGKPRVRPQNAVFYGAGSPTSFADLALVDITAAYFSLYSPLGLSPLYTSVRVEPDTQRPFIDLASFGAVKSVRNTVVSQLGRDTVRCLEYGEERIQKLDRRAFTYHPTTSQYVYDVLAQIARESIEMFGFVSYNTDGGCVDGGRAEEWVEWLSGRWGLAGRVVKRGAAVVTGASTCRFDGDGDDSDGDGEPAWPLEITPPVHPMGFLAPITRMLGSGRPAVDVERTAPPAWLVEVVAADRIGDPAVEWEVKKGRKVSVDIGGRKAFLRKVTDPTFCKYCDINIPDVDVVRTGGVLICPRCATRLGRRRSVVASPDAFQASLPFDAGVSWTTGVRILVEALPVEARDVGGRAVTYTCVWWRCRDRSDVCYAAGTVVDLALRKGAKLSVGWKHVVARRFGADRESWVLVVTGDPADVAVLEDDRLGIRVRVEGAIE